MLVCNWPSCQNLTSLCQSFLHSVILRTGTIEIAPVRCLVSSSPAEVMGKWKHSTLHRRPSGPRPYGGLNHLKEEVGTNVINKLSYLPPSFHLMQRESIRRSFSIVGPNPDKTGEKKGLYPSLPSALISSHTFIILLILSTLLLAVWGPGWKSFCILEKRF